MKYILSDNMILKLCLWQKNRFFWLLLALSGLLLIIFSLYFQLVLDKLPCKYCVYQRFAILLITVGFTFLIIKPMSCIIRKIGFLFITIASMYGLYAVAVQIYWQLNIDTLFSTCSLVAEFPFNLPLDKWLPVLFAPQVGCQESSFTIFNIPVTYWMLLVFVGYLVIIIACRWSYNYGKILTAKL